MRCECGCGTEGEDEVMQFALEEASFASLDEHEQRARGDAGAVFAQRQRLEALVLKVAGRR